MAKSQFAGSQIKDGTITRDDINVTTSGKAVVAKIIDGNNGVKIETSTGADPGTGDVAVKVDLTYLDSKYPSLSAVKTQNLVFASPSVGSGAATFRTLTSGDIPALPYSGQALSGGINSVKVGDTRNVNQYPSTDLQSGVWFDFKSNATMGITSGATFAAVMTFAPWSDNSGNFNSAFRLSQTGGEMYFQNYSAAGAWGAQNRLIHSNNMNSLLWSKYTTGNYTGVNAATPFSVLNANQAQNINCGGLLVSNQYADSQYVPTNGAYFKGQINTDSWVIPKYLAFPDSAGSNTNKVGFYYWTNEWQVNFRDANNTYLYPLLNINVTSKKADFFGVITNPEGDSTKWSQAYGWGNHALAGYVTNNQLTYKVNAANSTYGLEWDGSQTYLRRNNNLDGYLWHSGNLDPTKFVANGTGKYFISFDGFENYLGRDGNLVGYLWHSGNLNPSNFAAANHTHAFGSLTSKPTTLAGYGITDAISTSHVANSITVADINNWENMADYGVKQNVAFSTYTGAGLMLVDAYNGGESGMYDDQTGFSVAIKNNGYYKYGSQPNEFEGLNFDFDAKIFGIGRAPVAEKLEVDGKVMATKGFIHDQYNDPNYMLLGNGGVLHRADLSIIPETVDFSATTINITSQNKLVYAFASTSGTINLPEANITRKGQKIEVMKTSTSGSIVIQINGSVVFNLGWNYKYTFLCTGSNWLFTDQAGQCQIIS
jgi:hypothetical protein